MQIFIVKIFLVFHYFLMLFCFFFNFKSKFRLPFMGGVISNWNFFNLFSRKDLGDVSIVGLDGAGKTTILYVLKSMSVVETIPTIGFNVEKVRIGKAVLNVWDIGGQDKLRHMWQDYIDVSAGIVFVIDIQDRERWKDARQHIFSIIERQKSSGKGKKPILILANKADDPTDPNVEIAMEELKQTLGIEDWSYIGIKHASAKPVPPESTSYDRLYGAFNWLTDVMAGTTPKGKLWI